MENELTRELARHYAADHEPQTIAEALEGLARACWVRAGELPDHFHDEIAAAAFIRQALHALRRHAKFAGARRVFDAGRFKIPGASKNPEQRRLLLTFRLMANRLWETCVSDTYPYLLEVTGVHVDDQSELEERPLAPVTDEQVSAGTALTIRVPNWQKTADAIHLGLAGLLNSRELTYLPDRDAIRKALKRL